MNSVLQTKNATNEAMDECVWNFDAGCRGTWSASEWSQLCMWATFDSPRKNLAWWAVTRRTSKLSKLGGGHLCEDGCLPGTIQYYSSFLENSKPEYTTMCIYFFLHMNKTWIANGKNNFQNDWKAELVHPAAYSMLGVTFAPASWYMSGNSAWASLYAHP